MIFSIIGTNMKTPAFAYIYSTLPRTSVEIGATFPILYWDIFKKDIFRRIDFSIVKYLTFQDCAPLNKCHRSFLIMNKYYLHVSLYIHVLLALILVFPHKDLAKQTERERFDSLHAKPLYSYTFFKRSK